MFSLILYTNYSLLSPRVNQADLVDQVALRLWFFSFFNIKLSGNKYNSILKNYPSKVSLLKTTTNSVSNPQSPFMFASWSELNLVSIALLYYSTGPDSLYF